MASRRGGVSPQAHRGNPLRTRGQFIGKDKRRGPSAWSTRAPKSCPGTHRGMCVPRGSDGQGGDRIICAHLEVVKAVSCTAPSELTRAFSPVYLDAMPRRVLVTAPAPTLEETAREIGLSQKRARQIAEVMDAIVQKRLASGRLIRRRGKAARRVRSKRAAETHTRTSRS